MEFQLYVVVLDIMMPGMDEFETCRLIKSTALGIARGVALHDSGRKIDMDIAVIMG